MKTKTIINPKKYESGQAIIMIAVGMAILIGLVALTIDGTSAYSDRRHAQNAADTAAFAAARAKVREENPWQAAGLAIANKNFYMDNDFGAASSETKSNVEIYQCDAAGRPSYANCDIYEGSPDHIVVAITSVVDTYFARIVGVQNITNRVKAVTWADFIPPIDNAFGNAMLSLKQDCSGGGHPPYYVSGNATVEVTGSGIFVNADCGASAAYAQNGDASVASEGGICVVGTTNAVGAISNCAEQLPYPPPFVQKKITCDFNSPPDGIQPNEEGTYTQVVPPPNRTYLATPGYFPGDFPPSGAPGKIIMTTGIYCIEGDFNPPAEVTTDSNGNGDFDADSEGVLIMSINGIIQINGNADLDLHAISNPAAPEDAQNLLFYMPLTNPNDTIIINGGAYSELTGTILAPGADCDIHGADSTTINSQIICYTIDVSGAPGFTINYNASENTVLQPSPQIELIQ